MTSPAIQQIHFKLLEALKKKYRGCHKNDKTYLWLPPPYSNSLLPDKKGMSIWTWNGTQLLTEQSFGNSLCFGR